MAGDHKCPLCPATFTRPQHVGRHLRAHTGDRPYECKECPLRFARSDLLSRHVNKAHKTPEEGGTAGTKSAKKGRRKSNATSTVVEAEASHSSPEDNQAQQQQQQQQQRMRRASFDQPGLQAQRMYPNHPLLAGTPQPVQQPGTPVSWDLNALGTMPYSFNGLKPEQQGMTSVAMGRHGSLSSLSSLGFEFGFKKRACDQCNHSKVRCDFQEPCARCTHRNVTCTYNKPRSRTVTPILAARVPQVAGNLGMPLQGTSSPLAQFSSPLANQPMGPTVPMAVHRQSAPMALQTNQLDSIPPLPQQANVPSSVLWPQNFHMTEPVSMPNSTWNTPEMSQAMIESAHQLNGNMSYYTSPAQVNPTLPPAMPLRSLPGSMSSMIGGQSSSASPPQHMAPTPSLTSHEASPSSTDELPERRSSQNVTTIGSISRHGSQSHGNTKPTVQRLSFSDNSYGVPPTSTANWSPSQLTTTVSLAHPNSDMSASMPWPNTASTIDPRLQFRASMQSDDEGPVSSAASSSAVEFADSVPDSIAHQRRRSSASTGIWANAFNQMSLQDPANNARDGQLAFTNPFTASQIAQHVSTQPIPPMPAVNYQKRPSFPSVPIYDGVNLDAVKMPSLSDVKDIWKLYMSEPMSGPTPSAEKTRAAVEASMAGLPMVTPRPGMQRTLSKSNSMPDLKSPTTLPSGMSFNQQPPNGALPASGVTPKAVGGQPMVPVTPTTSEAIRKWQNELQSKSMNFQIQMQPGAGRMGKAAHTTQSHPQHSQPDQTMPPPRNRPLASVVQRSSALEQTLAPERQLSFGLQNTPDSASTATFNVAYPQAQPTANYSGALAQHMLDPKAKVSSMHARPGNKRLASQTLLPDTGKRASFSLWDGADESQDNHGDAADNTTLDGLAPWPGPSLGAPLHSMGAGGMTQGVAGAPSSGMYYNGWPVGQ